MYNAGRPALDLFPRIKFHAAGGDFKGLVGWVCCVAAGAVGGDELCDLLLGDVGCNGAVLLILLLILLRAVLLTLCNGR